MRKNHPNQRPSRETKPQRRVLARVLAEDLARVEGGRHNGGGVHTFTQCPPPCDFDID